MKWSVVALLVLGAVAALCAGLLVVALGLGRRPSLAGGGNEPTATVLVAARELPPMTVIDDGCLTAVSVPRGKLTAGSFSSSVEIAGKVLAVSLVRGQPFTPNSFAGDGSLVRLAGTLPAGKRAMSISVTDHGALDGVLYPGSIVDVLASFKSESGEGFSTVLVSGIEVLAVERLTVMGDSDGARRDPTSAVMTEAANAVRGGGTNSRRVTLLVDLKQAKSLQLAMEHGTISLVLRNPHDETKVGTEAMWTSSILQDSGVRARDAWAKVAANLVAAVAARAQSNAMATVSTAAPTTAPAKQAAAPVRPAQWETTIIRGSAIETREFELPPAAAGVTAAAAAAVGPLSQTR